MKTFALFAGLFFELSLAAVALLLGWAFGISPFRGVERGIVSLTAGIAMGIAAVLPPIALYFLALRVDCTAIQRLLETARGIVRRYLGPLPVSAVVALSFAAGLGEELLFRGLLQPLAASYLPLSLAVVTTSVLFALLHALNRVYVLFAFLMSVYLGAIFAATGSIVVPIVTHAIYDAVVLTHLQRHRQ